MASTNLRKTGTLPTLVIKDQDQNTILQMDGSKKFSGEYPEEFMFGTDGGIVNITVYAKDNIAIGNIVVPNNFGLVIIEDKVKRRDDEEED